MRVYSYSLSYEVHVSGKKGLRVQIEGETVSLAYGELLIVAPKCIPISFCQNVMDANALVIIVLIHHPYKAHLYLKRHIFAVNLQKKYLCFYNLLKKNVTILQNCTKRWKHIFSSCLMLALLRRFKKSSSLITRTYNEYNQRTIDIIDQYFLIKENNAPSKNELASLLNVSERQLDRMIISIFGMSFRQKDSKGTF